MGAAAIQRGDRAIRRGVDALIVPRPNSAKPLNWDSQRAALEGRIASLEAELRRARRCVAAQRAQITVERETNAELRGELEAVRRDRAEWAKAFLRMRRRWLYVSRIVRRFVSPSEVERFREEDKA